MVAFWGGHKSAPVRHKHMLSPPAFQLPTNKWRSAGLGRSWCLRSKTSFSATCVTACFQPHQATCLARPNVYIWWSVVLPHTDTPHFSKIVHCWRSTSEKASSTSARRISRLQNEGEDAQRGQECLFASSLGPNSAEKSVLKVRTPLGRQGTVLCTRLHQPERRYAKRGNLVPSLRSDVP